MLENHIILEKKKWEDEVFKYCIVDVDILSKIFCSASLGKGNPYHSVWEIFRVNDLFIHIRSCYCFAIISYNLAVISVSDIHSHIFTLHFIKKCFNITLSIRFSHGILE